MCSENVTSVPHFNFASGLGACFPIETSEAHTESEKLLQLGSVSCRSSIPVGHPTLSHIFEVLHGKNGKWRLQGTLPSQEAGLLATRSSVGGSDKHCHSLQLDAPISTCKQYRKCAPYVVHSLSTDYINALPDELLCHIFHFLVNTHDRLACASVSKRWLMLKSHMPRAAFAGEENSVSRVEAESNTERRGVSEDLDNEDVDETDIQEKGHGGDLSRCLTGRKASDVRLAAIALGTESCGGLGKLCIRGGSIAGLEVRVTDVGLSAIGSWCSSLRILSLWNCPYITDEGLSAIGKGCCLLERVDLSKCPLLGDSGLQVIAKRCSRLSFLNLDECEKVGDNGIVAVAEHCPNLTTLMVQNCPCVSDHGITRVVFLSKMLKKLKLAGLKLTDKSLTAIGSQARVLLWLTLQNLNLVTADGFVFFARAAGMQALKHLHISNCRNFSDFALMILGSHCGSLKHLCLHKCDRISDKGLGFFMNRASCLQVLHLEKCNVITGTGLVAALSGRCRELKEFHVKKCEGLRQVQGFGPPSIPHGYSLESICLEDCPGVGDLLVALVGLLCPEATTIDFSGLSDITDDGLLAFLCGSRKLTTLKLSGCVKVTDRAVCAIAHHCGQTLRNLILDGCKNLSNKTMTAIARHCSSLEDLDVSECTISDAGLEILFENTGQGLTSLNLSRCGVVTDRILPLIYKKCDSLLDLNLKNCSSLTERGISVFQSRMWNCSVLY